MAPPAGRAEINAQSPATIQFFRPWPELLLAFTVLAGAEWDCFAEPSPDCVMCDVMSGLLSFGASWSHRAGHLGSLGWYDLPGHGQPSLSNNLHFPDAKLVSDRFKYLRKWKVKEAVLVKLYGLRFKLTCLVQWTSSYPFFQLLNSNSNSIFRVIYNEFKHFLLVFIYLLAWGLSNAFIKAWICI